MAANDNEGQLMDETEARVEILEALARMPEMCTASACDSCGKVYFYYKDTDDNLCMLLCHKDGRIDPKCRGRMQQIDPATVPAHLGWTLH